MGDRHNEEAFEREIRVMHADSDLAVEMQNRLAARCTDRQDRLAWALGFIDTEPRLDTRWDEERFERDYRR